MGRWSKLVGSSLAGGLLVAASLAAPGAAASPKLVYFIFTGYTYPYFAPMAQGVEQAAKHFPEIKVKIVSANNSASTEITDIKEAIAGGAKGIILNTVQESVTSAAQQAMQQGIPVITIDRDVATPKARIAFIGDNDWNLGYLQTAYALKYLARHHVPKPWHVAILQGTLGSSTAIGRLDGALAALKPYEKSGAIKVVLNQSANFATANAESMISELLAKTTNVQLVVAANDAMALGAITAIKNAGLKPGKNVWVVGADAQPDSLYAIKAGTQLDTVTHSPFLEAYWAVEAMVAYLQHHQVPPAKFRNGNVIIPMVLVTRHNVSRISGWGTPQVIPPLPYGHFRAYPVK